MINRYPLAWPEGWKRTPSHQRRHAAFGKGEMKISVRHPDAGGSDAAMAELNRARDEARKELGQ